MQQTTNNAKPESTPIPESGVTPDNVLDNIDSVAGGLIDDLFGEEEQDEQTEQTEQTEQPEAPDEEPDQEAADPDESVSEDTPPDEDDEVTGAKEEWESLELEGSNKARVPFKLKVEKDGTRLYRFKAAEDTVEVDEAEMIAGYQRQQDYNRQKNELVREKDQLLPYSNILSYAETDPQFVQHIQSYFQNGPTAQVQGDLSITDDQIREAMQDDPDQAAELMSRREKAMQRYQVEQQASQAHQARMMDWANRQRALVMENYPDYDDVKGDLRDFLISEGFSEQEIDGQYDARMFALAYKAYQSDRSEQDRRAPKTELKDKRRKATPPKIIKSGAGKQSKTTPAKQQSVKRQKGLFSRALNSNNSEDWTAAIESMLPEDAI